MAVYRVYLYKQLGGSPDPENDILLAYDETIVNDEWELSSINLGEGYHALYTRSEDESGNFSAANTRVIAIVPNPLYVSSVISWTIGEVSSTQIGGFSS